MIEPNLSWLCVTRLPLDMTETQFYVLMSMYGPVDTCFLMASIVTGKSKGYGIVKYQTMEAATQARHLINHSTHITSICEWIPDIFVTYRSLHSKCLLVEHLPSIYKNLTMFRKIFSVIKEPIFCQVEHR